MGTTVEKTCGICLADTGLSHSVGWPPTTSIFLSTTCLDSELKKNNSTVYINHIFFTRCPDVGYLGWSHSLTAVNAAAIVRDKCKCFGCVCFESSGVDVVGHEKIS